jgi:hypothetical protein
VSSSVEGEGRYTCRPRLGIRDRNVPARRNAPVWGDDKFLEAGIKFAYGPDEKRYRRDPLNPGNERLILVGATSSSYAFAIRVILVISTMYLSSRGRSFYLSEAVC